MNAGHQSIGDQFRGVETCSLESCGITIFWWLYNYVVLSISLASMHVNGCQHLVQRILIPVRLNRVPCGDR